MSALTKIFIVLHVLLSIAFVSATIVLVNRTEDFRTSLNTTKTQLAQAKSAREAAVTELGTAKANYDKQVRELSDQVASLQQSIGTLEGNVSGLNERLATDQGTIVQLTASSANATEALKLAQDQLGIQLAQYNDLRKTADTMQKQATQDNLRIDDLVNTLQVTSRRLRDSQEELVQLQTKLDSADKTIKDNGLTVGENRGINAEPNIALNGVIREKMNIQDKPWASISLGSADHVVKDMQFKVIDPQTQTFLGYLTVQRVDEHDAMGTLDGPKVSEMRVGSEVRTQL